MAETAGEKSEESIGPEGRGLQARSAEPELAELRSRLDEANRKIREYENQLKYFQADFENYKRRTEAELNEAMHVFGVRFVSKLLDILDELELAVKSGRTSRTKKPLLEGVEMTLKKFSAVLESEGLQVIPTVGRVFDPNLHEAVATVEGKGPGLIVVEEVRKGYTFKGNVLRPAMVKVEIGPPIHQDIAEEKEGGAVEQRKG